jgi:hypothetical protein
MSNMSVYDNRQRDGIASLQKTARTLCQLVNTFAPIIELKYRNNAAVLAFLNAAQNVCSQLPAMDAALISTGASDDLGENYSNIPGSDVSAPPPAAYVAPD